MKNIDLLKAKQDEIDSLIHRIKPVLNMLQVMKKETSKRIREIEQKEKQYRQDERLTRAKIIFEHKTAGLTYEAIGNEFGITKQRARQIYLWYKKEQEKNNG